MKTNYCKIAALPLLIAALTVTVTFSCKKDTPEEPTLTVTNSSAVLVFSADGKTLTADGSTISPVFTVTTNQSSWDAKSDQTWLKLSKEDKQFVLSADANTDFNDVPAAKVTVTAGAAPAVVLYLTQQTPSPEESEYAAQSIILGHGYDVTGRYAYSPEVKSAVMDFAKLMREGKVKKDDNLQMAEFYTSVGSSASEYTKSLAVQAGISTQAGVQGVGAFSSELTARYESSKTSKDMYSFATSTSRIVKYAWFVDNRKDPGELRKYFTAAFLADSENIDRSTGEENINAIIRNIIEKYGTHVMLGGIWGAKLDHHFSAKKKIEAYAQDVSAKFAAKAEMNIEMISGSGEFSVGTQTAYASYYEEGSEETHTIAYGGLSELAREVHDAGSYTDWIVSIAGNEIWTDYYPESLVPIYEFIQDTEQRYALWLAFESYLKGKKINVASSRVSTQTNYEFQLVGANKIQGDGEIDSKEGKDTQWQVDVTLSKENTQLNANFTYYVTEGGTGDNISKFCMTKSVAIPINMDFIIDENPLEWGSGIQTYPHKYPESDNPDDRGWILVSWLSSASGGSNECPFMKYNDWYVKVDDKGGTDNDKVGVKGRLSIKYSYLAP